MTACSSKLQHLSYVDEAAWGDALTSASGAQTLPIVGGAVDASQFGRSMLESGRVTQLRNAVPRMIPGTFDGREFTIRLEAVGHGSATTGSISATAFENFLGWVIGAVATPPAGTTISGTSSTTTSLNVASSTGYLVGQLFRIGAKGDARADGQWAVASSVSTGVIGLAQAAIAAPTTSGDVVHSAVTVHTPETDCSISSKRFFLKTPDQSWIVHGCFPKGIKVTGGNPGQVVTYEITIGFSWCEPANSTFPDTSTTAAWTYLPAPAAAGRVVLSTYGSTTATELSARQVSVDITLGVVPVTGYTAASPYATIVGAKRVPDAIAVSVVIDSGGASASPTYWTEWAANDRKHLCVGYTIGAGAAVAVYFPALVYSGQQPTQQDLDGLNRLTLSFMAGADEAGATDLARSAMRWGFA